MIMIYDRTLSNYTAKAVPAWMKTDNYMELISRNSKKAVRRTFKSKRS